MASDLRNKLVDVHDERGVARCVLRFGAVFGGCGAVVAAVGLALGLATDVVHPQYDAYHAYNMSFVGTHWFYRRGSVEITEPPRTLFGLTTLPRDIDRIEPWLAESAYTRGNQ